MSDNPQYREAGVDTHKAQKALTDFQSFLKSRPRSPDLLSGVGPFAACFDLLPLLSHLEHPVLATCCDGVGTKLRLALEWDDISQLGQDLVAMNVNDLLCTGASPLQFLDYYATGKLDEHQLQTILKSIQNACEMSECFLVGGETAEMPGIYQQKDFDLAGFAVGLADKPHLLGPPKVCSGDVILGLGSSGLHSNGYSLMRKLVAQQGLVPDEKTPFSKKTWKEVLLEPTKIYVKMLKPVLKQVHALAHITGGGLYENLPRSIPPGLCAQLRKESFPRGGLFGWIEQVAEMDFHQMHSTFNGGIGMVVILSSQQVECVTQQARDFGTEVYVLGEIIPTASQEAPRIDWI